MNNNNADTLYLITKRHKLSLAPGTAIYQHQIDETSTDTSQTVGLVRSKPDDPSNIGIKNVSYTPWYVKRPGEEMKTIAPGSTVKIVKGTFITIGNHSIEVAQGQAAAVQMTQASPYMPPQQPSTPAYPQQQPPIQPQQNQPVMPPYQGQPQQNQPVMPPYQGQPQAPKELKKEPSAIAQILDAYGRSKKYDGAPKSKLYYGIGESLYGVGATIAGIVYMVNEPDILSFLILISGLVFGAIGIHSIRAYNKDRGK